MDPASWREPLEGRQPNKPRRAPGATRIGNPTAFTNRGKGGEEEGEREGSPREQLTGDQKF